MNDLFLHSFKFTDWYARKEVLTRVHSFLSLSKLTVYYLHMFLEFDPVLFTNKPTPAH